jgi:hypothetical protein
VIRFGFNMASIELSTEDAALIVLALAADRLGAAPRLDVGLLRRHWRDLGLRADDLIQGITALARDGRATAHGGDQDSYLQLSPACADALRAQQGIANLPLRLRELLGTAESRKADSDGPGSDERRNGFR